MSSAAEADVCCANCGIAEVDDIKLEECGGCDLVKYCSDKCREEHREQHDEECNRRAKELHDRKLFTQPDETHLGECPICFLPLPLDPQKCLFWSCCSSSTCKGCAYSDFKSIKCDERRCPFCREPAVRDEEDARKRIMERIKAKDPIALRYMGKGERFDKGDYKGAFHYFAKAAELGNFEAHFMLGWMYYEGEGVEKDEEKMVYHWEKAAIGGHPHARNNLGYYEEENGNKERAVKHFIIAAKLGYDLSMKALWKHYSAGNITKEDSDATLRSHQAAIDAMKSEQRDAGERYFSR
jgi:hypothetical protein